MNSLLLCYPAYVLTRVETKNSFSPFREHYFCLCAKIDENDETRQNPGKINKYWLVLKFLIKKGKTFRQQKGIIVCENNLMARASGRFTQICAKCLFSFLQVFCENICDIENINFHKFFRENMWKTRAHVSDSLNKFVVVKKFFSQQWNKAFRFNPIWTNCIYTLLPGYYQPSCLVIFKFTFKLKFCHFQIFLVALLLLSIKSPSILDDLNCVLPG